jgi:transcriptional regulator with GAF, ATPase, and Fis domain
MEPEITIQTAPRLIRESDGREFPLSGRLTTIGSSPQCKIVLSGDGIPAHVAHILFAEGAFTVSVVILNPPMFHNKQLLTNPAVLVEGDRLEVSNDVFVFRNGLHEEGKELNGESSPLRNFITALSVFTRTGNSDARFELLSSIAQLLSCDGARLVAENTDGSFSTIARFPKTCGLDRFSERAILWAKQQRATVLMHEGDWQEPAVRSDSLEMNKIGSILCRPLFEGETIRGYLYLDKKRGKKGFSEHDREILDDVGPVFSDLLALYDRSLRQHETIVRLQKILEAQTAPIVYGCEAMEQSIDRALKFSSTDSTVLITGETGTGKEVFARFIHGHSNRAGRNFCPINCGALPEHLIESELFGHEKGAFTGAYQKKTGLFEYADGGTVFLDEIGEMPLPMQVKVLRVLQESEILPIGANQTVRVDVRIVAATNKDLSVEVARGRFREDLFYRLSVLEIIIPALRDRHRDVLLLSDYFIKKYTQRFGLPEKGLTLAAQAKLLSYSWPGNIRQLDNVVQKAVLLSNNSLIDDADLDLPAQQDRRDRPEGISPPAVRTLKEARIHAEIECIRLALDKAGGNITIAARLLDTDRKWLTKLMKLHGISTAEKMAEPSDG